MVTKVAPPMSSFLERHTSVYAWLPYCASFQLTIISVKAPDASSPVGAGGTARLPPGTLGIKSKAPTPALGSKGLFLSSIAKPLSISSLKVIALSLGSPLLPSLTS